MRSEAIASARVQPNAHSAPAATMTARDPSASFVTSRNAAFMLRFASRPPARIARDRFFIAWFLLFKIKTCVVPFLPYIETCSGCLRFDLADRAPLHQGHRQDQLLLGQLRLIDIADQQLHRFFPLR